LLFFKDKSRSEVVAIMVEDGDDTFEEIVGS